MTKVDQLLTAIDGLSLEERAEFYKRLHHWEDDDWDRQIARDVESGKLDEVIARVRNDSRDGKLQGLP